VRPSYKQTEVGVIPEDWDVHGFLDVVRIAKGQVDPKVEPYRSMPLVAPDHIESGSGRLLEIKTAEEQKAISGKYLFAAGDIVYSKIRPYLRKAILADFSGLCSADMYPLTPVSETSGRFVFESLLAHRFTKYAESVSVRSGMPKINRVELADFRIALPRDPSEQRAIAEALADVDEAVAGLEQLIAKKHDLKQAAMSQLLTGQTRLPGFSGAWEVKRLGQIAELYQPKMISQAAFTLSGYPVYGANGVVGYYHSYNHEFPQIMISCRGNCGTVNRSSGPAWITGNAMVARLYGEGNSVQFDYIFHLLSTTDFSLVTTGSGQPQIVRGPLGTVELHLPNFAEQTAIATVLSDMDAELIALQAQLDKTRLIKQAMMQDLLTGRIRLPF